MLVFVLVCITLSPFWFTLENHRTLTAQSMICGGCSRRVYKIVDLVVKKRVIFWSIFYF